MKKDNLIVLMLLGFLFTTSCKKFVEGVNDDPNGFTDASAGLMIGQAQLASLMVAESQPARYAGIFTDQFTGTNRCSISDDSYMVTASDFSDMWRIFYQRGAAQAKLAMEKAQEEDKRQIEGIAEIFFAYYMGETSILFGDIPYSEAFQGADNRNPTYDDQEVVLNDVIAKLTDALGKVNSNNAYNKVFVENSFN